MTHLQNIAKLFEKGHVESPLLESFDAGNLHISSGRLVASDPLTTPDLPAFTVKFPKGSFPVSVHRERESGSIAYVEVVLGNTRPGRWEMALTEGQHLADLEGEEIFGYPSESGMGCFMDFETQQQLNKLEADLFDEKGDDFAGIYEEFFHGAFFSENGPVDQFAVLHPSERSKNNIIAFETGYGPGFYASYVGFDAADRPVKIITEFIEVLAE